ncbi:MAG: malate--CoA ligase subunit beta [Gammaproteobacteria bacterium]
MDIHEYQAKEILSEFGINIPCGGLAYSPEQAVFRAGEIGAGDFLVKAQIHSGGRDKAGGVKYCRNDEQIRSAAEELLGKRLFTRQTGPEGQVAHRLYLEEKVEVEQECYVGFVLDRKLERVVVVASREGGVDIEELSKSRPESIIRIAVEPAVGMQAFQARQIAFKLGIDKSLLTQMVTTLLGCYRAFRDLDATMIEMNPLVVTTDGQLLALDSKMSFDDCALFRRPRIANMKDKFQEDPLARKAAERGLEYVGLDGDIGCIINGAGLAMATMDMIEMVGGKPANFLDIGLGAQPDLVIKAFNLILSDPAVKVMLINIFAGINRCDWVAEGLVRALDKKKTTVPVIVRLAGTNAKTGKRILSESGLPIIMADSLRDAAEKAVAQSREQS